MSKKYLFLILIITTLTLSGLGCAKQTSPEALAPIYESDVDGQDRLQPVNQATEVWAKYQKLSAGEAPRPFRLDGSLRYTPPKGNGHRLSFYLWSNGEEPYRLDATAGFGTMVIGAREDTNDFSAYVPEEKKAYTHQGWQTPRFALPGLGEPLPVSIGDIAKLLEARFDLLFDKEYSLSTKVKAGDYPDLGRKFDGYIYTLLRGSLSGELILNSEGHPVYWKGIDGWGMFMEYADDSTNLKLRKLTINHEKGYKAIVLVKDREYPEGFNDSQLVLFIPSGTEVFPIKRMQ